VTSFVEGLRPDEFAGLDIGPVIIDPANPQPGQIATIRVPVHNSSLLPLEGVIIGVLAAARMVTWTSIDLSIDATEEAVLELAPTSAGAFRITIVVDPGHRLLVEPRDHTSVTIPLIVSDGPSRVVLQDLRWQAATRSIEVELRNRSDVPVYAPVVVIADGEVVCRTVVGPIPPQGLAVLAASWLGGMPGILSASIELPEADYPSARWSAKSRPERMKAKTTLTRDLRLESELQVEGLSVATVRSASGLPRRVTVSARVVNKGRSSTSVGCPVDLIMRPEGSLEPSGFSLLIAPLGPGSAVAVSHSFEFPVGVETAKLEVVADPDDRVAPASQAKRASLEFHDPAADVAHWISIGPTLIQLGLGAVGRLHQILLDPSRPGTIFVASGGAAGSGVWRTRDGGANWDPVTDGFGTPNVKAMAMDPSDSQRLWAATPDGVLHTDDGGDSWLVIANAAELEVENRAGGDLVLRVDPNNTSILYITGPTGLRRSVDGGATWSVVLNAGTATDLVVDTTPGRLYAAISNSDVALQTGVYRSDDYGSSWRKLTGCPSGLLPQVARPTTIRLAISGSTLYASFMEIGIGWTLLRTTGVGCLIGDRQESVWEQGWHPTGSVGSDPIFRRLWSGIYADPINSRIVYAGGTDLWVSKNGGTSFTRITEPHVDHHGFAFDPSDSSHVFTVSDGGLYWSNSHGDPGSWNFIAMGIRNTEFYDIAIAVTDPDLLIGGTQDNGTVRYDAPRTAWGCLRDGDGATVAIDSTDDSVMYSMGQYANSISRSSDSGTHWMGISSALSSGPECYNLYFQVHPTKPAIFLASCGSLWRLNQPDPTWRAIFTPLNGTVLRSAIDPRSDTYFAGTSLGEIFAGIGGAGFVPIFQNPSATLAVTDIEVDPDETDTVYVSYQGTGDGRVILASKVGSSYQALDITGNLPPDLLVRSLALDRKNRNTIYAGTDRGVHRGRMTSAMTAWEWDHYGSGLPDPDVRTILVHPISGVLYAATLGRGVYEVNTAPKQGSDWLPAITHMMLPESS
jgi:hypothetical protein